MGFIRLLLVGAVNFGVPYLLFLGSYVFDIAIFHDVFAPWLAAFMAFYANDDFSWEKTRPKVNAFLIALWASRFSSYLFHRNLKMPEKRLNSYRESAYRHIILLEWMIQAFWTLLKVMPTLLMVMSDYQPDIGWRDWFGWLVYLGGFSLETYANYQRALVEVDETENYYVPNTWMLSYYPTVAGEIIVWSGLLISASSAYASFWRYLLGLTLVIFDGWVIFKAQLSPFELCGSQKWDTQLQFQVYTGRPATR